MSLVGVDLNANRARAVIGPALQALNLVYLEADQIELPLAISLEERTPRVGRAGLALSRRKPHLACHDFLPHLGTSKSWAAPGHRLDPDAALGLVFRSLAGVLRRSAGLAFSLPSYLDEAQLTQLYRLAEAATLPVVGSMPAALAAVLASPLTDLPGLFLVVDVDNHALTWSIVERTSDQLRLRLVQPSTQLGRGAWLRKLVDGVSARCVRQCRRDPRESAETEQVLYEQLVSIIDQGQANIVQMHIQGAGWYHHAMMHTDELGGLAASLLRQAMAEMEGVVGTMEALGVLSGVVVTHAAAGLPGLLTTLRARLANYSRPVAVDSGDYGDHLMQAATSADFTHVIRADALACMAHELAVRVHRGDFPRGHLDAVALPEAVAASGDAGPPRVCFRGRDHVLLASPYMLGRDPSCHLVFESDLYPQVSGRHCSIVFDRRNYVLHDNSRHGTLVNDRPVRKAPLISGDWIRLGPQGPVLRFLGQTSEGKNTGQETMTPSPGDTKLSSTGDWR